MSKQEKQKNENSKAKRTEHNSMVVTGGRVGEGQEKIKGDQRYGDRRRLEFGWWAHSAIYRYHRMVHLKLV